MIVAAPVVAGLAVAAAISTAAPFAVHAYCRKRMTLPWRNIWLGVLFFAVFAMGLEGAMHWYFLRANRLTSAWLAGSIWGSSAYLAAAAALYEETARWIALRFLAKRVEAPGTAVSYAIGHGGFECLSVALVQIGGVAVCLLANAGMLDSLLGSVLSSATVAKVYAHTDVLTALAGGSERASALLAQIGFSLLVWRAVAAGKAKWWLLAVGAHFALDFVAMLAAKGLFPVLTLEAGVVGLGLILLIVFLRAGRREAKA